MDFSIICVCMFLEFGCNEVDNCPPNSQCVYDSDEFRYKCECVDGFSGDGETGSCVSTDDRKFWLTSRCTSDVFGYLLFAINKKIFLKIFCCDSLKRQSRVICLD